MQNLAGWILIFALRTSEFALHNGAEMQVASWNHTPTASISSISPPLPAVQTSFIWDILLTECNCWSIPCFPLCQCLHRLGSRMKQNRPDVTWYDQVHDRNVPRERKGPHSFLYVLYYPRMNFVEIWEEWLMWFPSWQLMPVSRSHYMTRLVLFYHRCTLRPLRCSPSRRRSLWRHWTGAQLDMFVG